MLPVMTSAAVAVGPRYTASGTPARSTTAMTTLLGLIAVAAVRTASIASCAVRNWQFGVHPSPRAATGARTARRARRATIRRVPRTTNDARGGVGMLTVPVILTDLPL